MERNDCVGHEIDLLRCSSEYHTHGYCTHGSSRSRCVVGLVAAAQGATPDMAKASGMDMPHPFYTHDELPDGVGSYVLAWRYSRRVSTARPRAGRRCGGRPVSHRARKHSLSHAGATRGTPDARVEACTPEKPALSRKDYKAQLHVLQVELVKLQRHFIGCGARILVLLEGRDAAGKDGSIKRIVEHLSPRETRVVALGKPSERERGGWYFQRYVAHLPVADELVLFNRSWYNRAGVEHVMGFCSPDEHEEFMQSVPKFEEMLVNSGITLLKYYLDIDKKEQKLRLAKRRRDPLKQWKRSPIDDVAVKQWKAYSEARDTMLLRTHTAVAPWHIVRADNKRIACLNLIRDILSRVHYAGKTKERVRPDPEVAFEFTPECIDARRLAR